MEKKKLKLLTIKEVADIFKVHERTVRNWIKHGYISYMKLGNTIRIPEDELESIFKQYMKRRR